MERWRCQRRAHHHYLQHPLKLCQEARSILDTSWDRGKQQSELEELPAPHADVCLTEISGYCRYIDAPMADVATRQPMLATIQPMEERAAAARERHALHSAEGMPHPAFSSLHVESLSRCHACVVEESLQQREQRTDLRMRRSYAVLAGTMDCAETHSPSTHPGAAARSANMQHDAVSSVQRRSR